MTAMKNLTVTLVLLTMAVSSQAVVIDGYDFDSPGTLERLSKLTRAEVDALSPDIRRESLSSHSAKAGSRDAAYSVTFR